MLKGFRSVSCNTLALAFFISTTTAFSTVGSTHNGRLCPIRTELHSSTNNELSLQDHLPQDENMGSRRVMISNSLKSFAAMSFGLFGSNIRDASAAFNNRLGGLPNKIRGVCLVMVSLFSLKKRPLKFESNSTINNDRIVLSNYSLPTSLICVQYF